MTSAIPLLDLKAQHARIRDEIQLAIARVIECQHFILGPEVDALEKEIAAYSRVKHAIGLSSGTDAILVALMALGIEPGDEVITTPYTFIATCSCIARLGARAVFVDVEPGSFNLDATQVREVITSKTKALMPVHLFGQMADVQALKSFGLPIVEDAAQALGAELHGQRAGAVGSIGTYSFFPSKNLGAFGDGGMAVTNDDQLAARIRLIRNQGQQPKYFSKVIGGNFRLDALQAAVLRAKLPHLDGWSKARGDNAAAYRKLFAGVERVVVPPELPNRRHVYNQFVIRLPDNRRDQVRQSLSEAGIGSEVYYPQPMHLQECFAHWGYRAGQFPESERAATESLAIPIYPELTAAMQTRVVDVISRALA